MLQSNTALQVANREIETSSYSVSHDLRAPLRSIQGFSQILMEDYASQLEPQALNYLTRVRDGGVWMSQLIDELLKLSRLSRGPLNQTNINLSAMVTQMADNLRLRQPEREVEFVGLSLNARVHSGRSKSLGQLIRHGNWSAISGPGQLRARLAIRCRRKRPTNQ